MEWPLMSKRRYKEVKADLHFTTSHLMEAMCTARSLERIVHHLIVNLKSPDCAPDVLRLTENLRHTFQKQVESIVQHTKWPTKPATLARQLHQLDYKKQQQDPLAQLQETLQDNHLLLEKLSAEEQRSTRVEAELAATCQREAELRDAYEEFVKTSKQQQEEAATSYRTGREELIKKEYQDQRTISMLQRVTADQATQIENLQEQLALSEKSKFKALRQMAVLAESGAKQFKELTQAQAEVGQLSLKVSAAEQLNKQLQQEKAKLQEEAAAAEQLNKQLQQEKEEVQEALDRLESAADCAADEPGTPVQRISSTMFSCCEVAA